MRVASAPAHIAHEEAVRQRPPSPSISTRHSGRASLASTVARGGAWPAGTQASQARSCRRNRRCRRERPAPAGSGSCRCPPRRAAVDCRAPGASGRRCPGRVVGHLAGEVDGAGVDRRVAVTGGRIRERRGRGPHAMGRRSSRVKRRVRKSSVACQVCGEFRMPRWPVRRMAS